MADEPYRPAVGDLVAATLRVTLADTLPNGRVILRLEPAASYGPPAWDQVVWLDARQVTPAGRVGP